MFARKAHRGDHVGSAFASRNNGGPPVDVRVPHLASRVIARIGGQHEVTNEVLAK
jgi:hypothetical protein